MGALRPYKEYGKDDAQEEVNCFNDLDPAAYYSYSDYLRWTFEDRVELIKGKLFKMSPAPSRIHQDISKNLFLLLGNFLRHKPCKVYSAPFDVRLPTKQKSTDDKLIYNVLQPDIIVVCDSEKLDDRGCLGAPDIVVEILSPGNNSRELRYKYDVYEMAGVKEYWIVWPESKSLMRYILGLDGRYVPTKMLTLGERFDTAVLPGLVIDIDAVFEE
ncbi:Uma2 family endonuclease [Olivibacter sitiensis]|uniref:Uma2 family endonuclease n=1 Tax=Olivibacter sitiensis TaxID=376470 RepID=UPI000429FCB0|nr:Uma2 family endonuclease [Olivibacter sitiensis]